MIKTSYENYVKPFVKDCLSFLYDLFFPIFCLCCGKAGFFICLKCQGELEHVDAQLCIICNKPNIFGLTHPKCKTKWSPEGTISFFNYHDTNVATIIIQGKYSFLPDVYKQLGTIIGLTLEPYHPIFKEDFILVPIPLSRRRYRWRGFNQSEILCKVLSQMWYMETRNILTRPKGTKVQKDLKREQRLKNMENAFSLVNPSLQVKNKNIIVVDDVSTTGSTLLEAVKVLQKNGANKIWCLTVAKD